MALNVITAAAKSARVSTGDLPGSGGKQKGRREQSRETCHGHPNATQTDVILADVQVIQASAQGGQRALRAEFGTG